MSRGSPEPEKKREEGERAEEHKCEVMEREAVTGGVGVSVLACGGAQAGVFSQLSKIVDGRGWVGVWSLVIPEGFVTLCGGDTSEDLPAPAVGSQLRPQCSPEGRRVPVASRHHTRAPSCPAVDSDWTGSIKSSLCFASRGLTSFSVFMGKSFHSTQQFPFPNHESAGQRRHQCRRLCLWNQRMTNFLITDHDRSNLPAFHPYLLVNYCDLDLSTGRVFPSALPTAL